MRNKGKKVQRVKVKVPDRSVEENREIRARMSEIIGSVSYDTLLQLKQGINEIQQQNSVEEKCRLNPKHYTHAPLS